MTRIPIVRFVMISIANVDVNANTATKQLKITKTTSRDSSSVIEKSANMAAMNNANRTIWDKYPNSHKYFGLSALRSRDRDLPSVCDGDSYGFDKRQDLDMFPDD